MVKGIIRLTDYERVIVSIEYDGKIMRNKIIEKWTEEHYRDRTLYIQIAPRTTSNEKIIKSNLKKAALHPIPDEFKIENEEPA